MKNVYLPSNRNKLFGLLLSSCSLFFSTQSYSADCSPIETELSTINNGSVPLLSIESVKSCVNQQLKLQLANAYLNNNYADRALLILSSLESLFSLHPQALATIQILQAEAFSQKENLCKAQVLLNSALEVLGKENETIKEVSLKLEFLRSKKVLDERTLNCMLTASRNAASRGIVVEPTINITIPFETNSDQITHRGKQQLNSLIDVLSGEEYDAYTFEFIGHADKRGDQNYNLALSKRRAKSVERYVHRLSSTIASRTMSSGKGEAELKSEGDSAEDHAINRRVEVILKEK
jgi:outer membrane protein OmpA-like peptidoglycan-associated protein